MPGLFGGGGGSAPAGNVNIQPQAQLGQVYTPQNQPGLDQSFQSLLTNLYNPALGGLQASGGINPAQTIYPQAANIGGALSNLSDSTYGGYGPYAGNAILAALNAQGGLAGLQGSGKGPLGYGTAAGDTAAGLLPSAFNLGLNPGYGQAVSGIQNNPYFTQAINSAEGGANIAGNAAGNAAPLMQQLYQLASGLPSAGQTAAGQAGAQIPQIQQLGSGLASAAPNILQQAQSLNPQLQQLFQGLVPGLTSQIPGLTSAALGNNAGNLAGISQAGRSLINAAPGYAGQELSLNAPLAGAESGILQSGFDPQSALYNRTQQQVTDQQNAVNSASGVGTSPYGAGVTGQAQQNFNIDWQNQQLQRKIAAGQAASGLAGQQASNITGAGNLVSGLTQAGSNIGLGAAGQGLSNIEGGAGILGNLSGAASGIGTGLTSQQINALLGGASAYGNLAGTAGGLAGTGANLAGSSLQDILAGAGGAGSLAGTGLSLGGAASNLAATAGAQPANEFNAQQQAIIQALLQQGAGTLQGIQGVGSLGSTLANAGTGQLQGLQAGAQFGALPYQTAATSGQNALNALTQEQNLGNAQYQLPQQVLNDIQSYLGLGQSAASIGGQLGALGSQGQQQNLSNIGTLGSLAIPGLFGQSGLGLSGGSGILGSGTSGLLTGGGLAGLFGGGGSSGLLSGLFSGGGGGLLNFGAGVPFFV